MLAEDKLSVAVPHRKRDVRMTSSVFDDLAIWMVGAGIVIGAVFPPVLVMFGVPGNIVITPFFISVCLLAGTVVGGINIWLMRSVVMPKLRDLVDGMQLIESVIDDANFSGDWSRCNPEACQLPVDSKDIIGESATAFNRLVLALHAGHIVEKRVADFSKSMTSQLELVPLCEGALNGFIGATRATAGAILADVGGELSVLANVGIVDAARLTENEHVRLALQSQDPLCIALPQGLSIDAGLVEFRPREIVFIPLAVQSSTIGVVILAGPDEFERDSRSLAQIFRRTLAVALANAMTHDNLQRVAALDPLTNCYNRRFGFARLREEYSRATRNDAALGIILFDIDHFKSVNDNYGHLVGDRVLASVSKVAGKQLREGDVLVRYGGEEFLCILPGASAEDTGKISERIRFAIEASTIQDRDHTVSCTISAGYCALPSTTAKDEHALVQAADEALYFAKGDGRNRSIRTTGSESYQ